MREIEWRFSLLVIERVCKSKWVETSTRKKEIAKKAHRGKKSEKKNFGPPPRPRLCSKKKQKESSLSLFLLILTNTKRKTYKHGGCAFDRFLFCNALPLILSLSFSLSKGRERFFVRFRLKSSYVRHGFLLLFSFVFVCSSVQVVCVSADRLSLFFVRATPARARVSCVLFDDDDGDDDDDARVAIQLAPPERWLCARGTISCRERRDNRHIIILFSSHKSFLLTLLMENRRKHTSHWRRQAHVENRSDFVQH